MQSELVIQKPSEDQQPNLMALIAEASAHFDDSKVAIMRQLIDLKLQMDDRDAKKAYNMAMIEAQQEIEPVVRNRKNEEKGNLFADLEAIDKAIRPIYQKYGFAITFGGAEVKDGLVTLKAECIHKAGHSEPFVTQGAVDDLGPKGTPNKTKIQGAVSTVSYLKRVLTCSIFNVITTDQKRQPGGPDNDGVTTISEEQQEKIISLLIENGITEREFLAMAKRNSISEIPANRYDAAVNAIKAKGLAKGK